MRMRLVAVLTGLLLLSCSSSPPTQYYSLSLNSPVSNQTPIRYVVELLPIQVPEALDRPQLVFNTAETRLDIRDDQRWLVPLSAELRTVLWQGLWSQIGAVDSYQSGQSDSDSLPHYRVSVQLMRLDALLAQQAVLQAQWSIKNLHNQQVLRCVESAQQPLKDGSVDTAVQAYRQLLADWLKQIALSIDMPTKAKQCR